MNATKPSRYSFSIMFLKSQIGLLALILFFGSMRYLSAQTSGKVIKWDQPPTLAAPTNVFYGWNEESVFGLRVAADDWVCTTTNPVKKIRWWGSFVGFTGSDPTPVLPSDFRIHFWTDVPAAGTTTFSHPGVTVWQIICTNFTWRCVGQDYDPRTGQFETCFLFEQTLNPQEWFFQNPLTGTNIYWLSIAADYPFGIPANNHFGWKTRPRSTTSLAPDAAVVIVNPNNPIFPPSVPFLNGAPIVGPAGTTNAWDLAFELVTSGTITTANSKWEQLPDLSTNGIDVNATFDPNDPTPPTPPYVLADDWQCTQPGFITNIVIWGSWLNDKLPRNVQGQPSATNVQFVLSIHRDNPTNAAQLFSTPSNLVWSAVFPPGSYSSSIYQSGIKEGWINPVPVPPLPYFFPADTNCYEYDFNLPSAGNEPYFQQGTPANPFVYWLDVQAQIVGPQDTTNRPRFGWKTSASHWNDDAVWANFVEPGSPPITAWNELHYPLVVNQGKSIDLAFRINTLSSVSENVKWSQPPVVASNPGNWYNGWNEPSIDGGGIWNNILLTNIVADDWLCTNSRPVSDIHWWGSFLNWTGAGLPPQPPVGYRFAIWTDTPTNANNPFSHPGTVLWSSFASTTDANLSFQWVGWDLDPRDPCLSGIDSCFLFNYRLPQAEWFLQPNGTNIFWLSIAAKYPTFNVGQNPFGWKTRPHVPVPPDDAVRIFNPLIPTLGSPFVSGQPIEYPTGTSWDMAYRLTTCQRFPVTNVVFTNIFVTNILAQQILRVQWNAAPGAVYQLQETTYLSNAPSFSIWVDVGPPVVGPANTQFVTNSPSYLYRFYRLRLPDICP